MVDGNIISIISEKSLYDELVGVCIVNHQEVSQEFHSDQRS
jgi:hypothetical protein